MQISLNALARVLLVIFSLTSCTKEEAATKIPGEVITKELENTTPTSVIAYGSVISEGSNPISDRGFAIGPMPNPTLTDRKESIGKGLGDFSATISNLLPGTKYYIRAYVTNAGGTAYGEDKSFTTPFGLVGFYPFNGNVNDATANGNNGVNEGATSITDRFGEANRAFRFNGIDEWLSIPHSMKLKPENLTISAWIRVAGTDFNQPYCVLQYQDINGQPIKLAYSMYFSDTNSVYGAYGTGSCNTVSGDQYFGTADKVSPDAWTLFTVTISTSGFVSMYINGALSNSYQGNPFQPCMDTNTHIRVGKGWDGDPRWFKGDIDDIQIYDYILTPEEISNLAKQ